MADSHPTYDKNRNPIFNKRQSKINQDHKWREDCNKEFHEQYGHWYYFAGLKHSKNKGWIEQYRKEPNRGN